MRWLLVLLLAGCTANAQTPHMDQPRAGWSSRHMPYSSHSHTGPNGEVIA